MVSYGILRRHSSESTGKAPPPKAQSGIILNPDNTPRNIEGAGNRVFDSGFSDGHHNVPDTMTFTGSAIEGVPKAHPVVQGTVAHVDYTYVNAGVTVKVSTTISLKDLEAYRQFVQAGNNVDPMRKDALLNKLDLLKSQMENGIPGKAGQPGVEGIHKFYEREQKKYPEAQRDPLNGKFDQDGHFVRNLPNGKLPPSYDPSATSAHGKAPPSYDPSKQTRTLTAAAQQKAAPLRKAPAVPAH